jgi:hypothetical protein
LSFRNDNLALMRSLLGKASGVSIGGINFRKVMEFRSEAPGCQAVKDSLEVERFLYPRQLLSIIRLKNAHSL